MSLLCFCLFSLSLFSSSCWWKVKTKVAQSCVTLWDPIDCSPPGSSVHGVLEARILEWLFPSPGDLPKPGIEPRSPALQMDSLPSEPPEKLMEFIVLHKKRCVYHTYSRVCYIYYILLHTLYCIYTILLIVCPVVPDSATPWTAARQAPLSMEFSRQEY